jgi:hypothetical protein
VPERVGRPIPPSCSLSHNAALSHMQNLSKPLEVCSSSDRVPLYRCPRAPPWSSFAPATQRRRILVLYCCRLRVDAAGSPSPLLCHHLPYASTSWTHPSHVAPCEGKGSLSCAIQKNSGPFRFCRLMSAVKSQTLGRAPHSLVASEPLLEALGRRWRGRLQRCSQQVRQDAGGGVRIGQPKIPPGSSLAAAVPEDG